MKKKLLPLILIILLIVALAGSWLVFHQLQYRSAQQYIKSIGLNPADYSRKDSITFWKDMSSGSELSSPTQEIIKKDANSIVDHLKDIPQKTLKDLIESGAFDTILSVKKIPSGEAGQITPTMDGTDLQNLINSKSESDKTTFTGKVSQINKLVLLISINDNDKFKEIKLSLTPQTKIMFSDLTKAEPADIQLKDQLTFTLTDDIKSGSPAEGTAFTIIINP